MKAFLLLYVVATLFLQAQGARVYVVLFTHIEDNTPVATKRMILTK